MVIRVTSINESHRIAPCLELLVPLCWSEPLTPAIAPALAVLREALEGLAKSPLCDESGVRAALHLVRDYGDRQLLDLLHVAAASPRREAVRGLAAAMLFDAGEQDAALRCATTLLGSCPLSSVAWGALIQAAHAANEPEIATEATVRRIQFGWSE